ncbi:MAG TPA: DUF433 domain-containing protein [Acidisarcina sp.]
MDWTGCELVEVVPGKMSGAPVIKGTRVTPGTVVVNRELGEDEIAYQFRLPVYAVHSILEYWLAHQPALVR